MRTMPIPIAFASLARGRIGGGWQVVPAKSCKHTDSRYADRLNLGLQEHATKSQNGTSSSVIP